MAITDNTHSTDLESGSSQYWSITDASQTGLEPTNNFTISLWLNPETLQLSYPFIKGNDDNQMNYRIEMNGTGNIGFYLSHTLGTYNISSTITLSTGTWFHIVARKKSTSVGMELFIDGSSDASGSANTAPAETNDSDIQIGARKDTPQDFFDGKIDDIRFWDRALTDQEISDLNSDPCNFDNGTNLQGWWLFDNDGTDETANANDLTNNNTATFSTDVAYSCAVSFIPKITMF